MELNNGNTDDEATTDSRGFRNLLSYGFRRNQDDVPDTIPSEQQLGPAPAPGCDRDAENYHMAHPHRGIALVFNHEQFDKLPVRKGTSKDCQALSKALKDLGFDVDVRQDLTYHEIKTCLSEVAAMNHRDADCLLVAVMSHGDPDILYAKDKSYLVKELWEPFTPDKCISLTGKPKMFFIQACRGNKVDDGVAVMESVEMDCPDGTASTYTIPLQADFLVAFATVGGYYAWRNPISGSWFIKSLCYELQLNGTSRDLLTLLTFVCRRIAVGYESMVPYVDEMNRKKQVPTITSTLTRLVYFRLNKDRRSS